MTIKCNDDLWTLTDPPIQRERAGFPMMSKQILENLWGSSSDSIAFGELVRFYRTATEHQIQKMKNAIKNTDWQTFKKLIKKSGVTPETDSCLPTSIDDPLA